MEINYEQESDDNQEEFLNDLVHKFQQEKVLSSQDITRMKDEFIDKIKVATFG